MENFDNMDGTMVNDGAVREEEGKKLSYSVLSPFNEEANSDMADSLMNGGDMEMKNPFKSEDVSSLNKEGDVFGGTDGGDASLTDGALQNETRFDDVEKYGEVLANLGEEFGKIKYLSNEQNLDLPTFNADMVDEDAPFSSFVMAGKWLREAADLSNYWEGIQRLGEDTASYIWAYKEGELGEFSTGKFAKEVMRAGVRSLGQDSLRTTGGLLTMFGANLENGSAVTTILTSGAGAILPQTGQLFKDLGKAFRTYADEVGNISFLAAPQEAFEESPSWNKLANVLGSGSSQVLAMAGMSRLIGAGATYGFFAGGGASEIFEETLEQSGDVEQANTLAAMNAGTTFTIDKLFNPLPETIAKNAKLTSKKVAKEMLGAPLREAGSEVLQQMLAENLVRKVGIDDTQDLFEGLLESALGAIAGSAAVSGASGTVYLAQEGLNLIRQKIMLKGVTAEELELYENNMMALIEQKPEAFEKILGANLKESLRQMDLAARALKNRKERAEKRQDVKGFQDVYEEMYNRFLPVLGDEAKSKAAARMFEANAISFYQKNPEFTPRKLMDGLLPKLQKIDAASFLNEKMSEQAVSFSLIGINAKNADTTKLTRAMYMLENGADPVWIWSKTGWHFGGDGKWRMEISDKDAYIKRWDDMPDIKDKVIDRLHDHKIQMDKIKAYLAAGLRRSSMTGMGMFYDDFYKYLSEKYANDKTGIEEDNKNGQEDVVYDDELLEYGLEDVQDDEPKSIFDRNLGLFEVISEMDRKKREAADALLEDLMWRYQKMHPEIKRFTTLDEFEDAMANKQAFDFSEDEYNYIMGALEFRKRTEFFDKYWDKQTGVQNSKEFRLLAETANFKYEDDAAYIEGLAGVFHNSQQRRRRRLAKLKKHNIARYKYFFEDIDKDEAYGKYRLYTGDFTPDRSGENFYPLSYRLAYLPKTESELFLAQKKFDYMEEKDKRLLAGYLDVVEKIFQADMYFKEIEQHEEFQHIVSEGLEAPDENIRLPSGEINWDYLMERKRQLQNMPTHLGDILEHPELFANYPNLADMNIRFTHLQDDEMYHVYYKADEGYVLEIDTSRVGKADLKEVLLKGAAFAIQDMEGFDYSLTKNQRRNFMNRLIFKASREAENVVLHNLQEYVEHYLPDEDLKQFVLENSFPMPLVGLTQSMDIDDMSVVEKKASFYSVDYDKLFKAVQKKYERGLYARDKRVSHLAYMDFQQMKRMNTTMIMAEARANGGYSAGGLPWAGITSQGAMDERALSSRMSYSAEQLAESPFFDVGNDLLPIDEKVKKGIQSKVSYVPDVMDPYDEFVDIIAKDKKRYRDRLEVLAKGAYDSAERTISLFESADADTIVHETFHYFWDLMENTEYRNETHAAVFHEVIGELREDFVREFVVKEFDGKWYALHKSTDEIMEELPRGFASKRDAFDAGVRELFVTQFLKLLNKETFYNEGGKISDAANFYREWLNTLVDKLEIKKANASADGKRLLSFLKKKIK